MKKKYDYYKLDVGFFPDVMKLCFDNAVFQQILADHKITLKASALDTGVAETHQIGDGKEGIIILVFNLDEIGDDIGNIADTISHEVSHAVDHLAEFIGEEDGFVNETRAYLTGSLVKQIFKIYFHEKENRARKASREQAKQAGKAKRGAQPEIHIEYIGRTGSHSIIELQDIIRGAEDDDRSAKPSPETGV